MAFWFEFEKISDLPNETIRGGTITSNQSDSDLSSALSTTSIWNGLERLFSGRLQVRFARLG